MMFNRLVPKRRVTVLLRVIFIHDDILVVTMTGCGVERSWNANEAYRGKSQKIKKRKENINSNKNQIKIREKHVRREAKASSLSNIKGQIMDHGENYKEKKYKPRVM